LTQIHMGHIPLNFYLHHIKRSESSNCVACQGRGLAAKETLTHYLFKCEAYNRECHELDQWMRRDSRDLATLVSTEKGVKALVNFVNKTGQLSPAKGEISVS
jgi:transcriptional regulator GlxA family with amidase domain